MALLEPTAGRVAQWSTRPPTERKIVGSTPAVVEIFLFSITRTDINVNIFLLLSGKTTLTRHE